MPSFSRWDHLVKGQTLTLYCQIALQKDALLLSAVYEYGDFLALLPNLHLKKNNQPTKTTPLALTVLYDLILKLFI